MITVNLKGGLGNQLFQYSAGRALSLKYRTNLKLDVTGYNRKSGINTPREYALSPFNINAQLIKDIAEIYRYRNPYGIFTKLLRMLKMKVLRLFNSKYYSSIFSKNKSIYLDGFFQSEKYFKDFEKEIRQDLTLKGPLSTESQKISDQIYEKRNSGFVTVSLHVRRGDYVSNAKTNAYHGTCSPEYYAKAIEIINEKNGGRKNVSIFVFSDDIKWVESNMIFPTGVDVNYVSRPEIPDFEEMHLMSLCDQHIIANSSFSWWGAWLDPKPNKLVIAPKNWTKKAEKHFKDIVPENWTRV